MQTPPHLLMFHFAGALGGAERTSALLLRYLHETQTATVTVIGSALLCPVLSPYCKRYIDGNALGFGFWFTDIQGLRRDALRAAALIREINPDLVLGMMHYGAALAVLGGRLKGRPIRTIASLRGPAYEYIIRYETNPRRRLFLRTAIGITGLLADQVLVPSTGTGEELVRRFLVPRRRIEVIPNGIDQQSVNLALQEQVVDLDDLPTDRPIICAIARLSAEKELGLLLHAVQIVQQHCPVTLLVIGEGPERAGLEKQTVTLGINTSVHFIGYRANVFPYLARADIFIHTCQFEGFGYTMLEAMACGVPVIATDCPYGPREVIATEEQGILVPPGNPQALAAAVLTVLDDPNMQRKLSLGAKARAQVLSVESMMAKYGAMLHKLTIDYI